MERKIKQIFCFFTIVVFSLMPIQQGLAIAPYESYTYNFWLEPVTSPAPYLPLDEVNGNDLGVGTFDEPNDLFIDSKGTIYVVDSKNNRIVYFDQNMKNVGEISEFNQGDTFNYPRGIYVSKDGKKFVADTENQRIVEFNEKNEYVREYGRPDTHLITDRTGFRPTKVVVNEAGTLYILAIGINSGIIEMNPDGSFQGFIGATEVSINPITYIWRRYFATEEQLKRMELVLPTEYNNIYLDVDEFLFVTIGNLKPEDRGKDVIRRLNPAGKNVLRDFGYGPPIGDYFVRDSNQITQFSDITVTEDLIYHALDGNNGKIFTYDYDGNLLHVFGSNGNREGNFFNAISIDHYEDKLFVLDSRKNAVLSFEQTAYGRAISEAIHAHNNGEYDVAERKWREVLEYNANADIAYTGLGKIYLRKEQNKEAMEYFKLSDNRKYYSKAFTNYRRDFLNQYFGRMMTIFLIALIGYFIVNLIIKIIRFNRRLKRGFENESLY